jgi:hypothetical protein
MLWVRNLKLVNRTNEDEGITKNKTIIDYAIQYVRREEIDNREIEVIKHIRLYKRMILPY